MGAKEGETRSDRQIDMRERKKAGRNNEWPGRGISFNPFYALGRAPSDRHGGRLSRYETRSEAGI